MPPTTSCHTCGKILTHTEHGGLCGACLFQSLLTGKEVSKADEPPSDIWRVPGYEMGPEIGRGGSAVVYRARQCDPERIVALKILLPIWTDGTGVRERFRLEAQALAQLDHPGILPVLASGEVDGVPWYSMPLAAGGTLSERRTLVGGQFRQIAEWLAGAAEAVAHAHARGVLHRDLKPGNLLFADDGRLFVSDFGLARVLATSSNVTMTAAMLGTPAYMAPEVIAHGIRAATVAADVWGLGAILYELLAGRRPFEAESIPELVRSVVGDEPPPLRAVPSDLAAITFRALHKNPERRYSTVLAMAADLRAWLAGEPVTARPYPWWERLQFATKRHPWAAGGIAVAILFSVATAAVGVRETRLRREEQSARLAADQEAATSREILKFLQNDLLAQASPESEPDRDIKLRTVLDRAAKSVDGRFPNQPLVEAAIHETLASTYTALGEEAAGSSHANKALALFIREKGPDAPEVLRLRQYEIRDDCAKGKFVEAEALSRQVLAVTRRIMAPDQPDIYKAWGVLSEVYSAQAKWDQAEKIIHEALDASSQALGPDNPTTIELEVKRATALGETTRKAESLEILYHCLDTSRRVLGKENALTLVIMDDLAVALDAMDKKAESDALLRELLVLRRRVLGPEHPATVITLVNLATGLSTEGKFQEAIDLFQEARQIYLRTIGPEDVRTLTFDTRFAHSLHNAGRNREGAELAAKDLPILERVLGPAHQDTLLLRLTLCECLRGTGQSAEAITVATQCVEIANRTLGPDNDFVFGSKLQLAGAFKDANRVEAAAAIYQDVLAIATKSRGGEMFWAALTARCRLAELLMLERKFAEAETDVRRLVDDAAQKYGPADMMCLDMKVDLGCLLLQRLAGQEAEKVLREVVTCRERDAGLDAGPTLAALDAWSVAAGLQGRWPDAEATLRRSGEHWNNLEPGGLREALNRISLGWVLYASGHRTEASPLLNAGYSLVTNPAKFTPSERLVRSVVATRIADAYRESGDVEASAKWQMLMAP